MFTETNTQIEIDGEYFSLIRNPEDPLLRRKIAAKYLDVSPGTMAVWDCTKRHDLKPIKIGRYVYYRKSVLDAVLEDRIKP